MDPDDILTSVETLKALKPFQRQRFMESSEGREFVKGLPEGPRASMMEAVGLGRLEKHMSIVELSTYSPEPQTIPEDRTKAMGGYPDRRLNSDLVYRAVLARVADPQLHWTRQSDLCHEFRASAESIEAALLQHVWGGRVAFEKTDEQMLFART